MYQIHRQDILEWAREYQGEKFHAMLTDCPYHLTSITKRFGKEGSAPAKGDVYARSAAGFMGQQWDGGGIAFDPATWAALAQHLYPGAFIMAFGGSRGYHRMACAMEDAGLIIHPAMGWLTLSGFPKATRIKGYGSPAFKGHRYGLQALKPAFEFIAVAQVPYEGRPVDSIVSSGAGALNIDGGRIATGENLSGGSVTSNRKAPMAGDERTGAALGMFAPGAERKEEWTNPAGRWPANFILSHSPLDNGECHPDCPVRLFDEQAGVGTGGHSLGDLDKDYEHKDTYLYGKYANATPTSEYNDSGPASRMFHQSTWAYEVAEQLANAEPVRYEPKVSSSEREAGLDGFEVMAPHAAYGEFKGTPEHATNMNGKMRNNHPTLKPISLTKYLATLLLPPAAYAPRRILIPFGGVGSEGAGAILAGWEEVVIVEKEAEYCRIMEPRLRWWSQWPGWGQTDVDTILAAAGKDKPGQMSLFPQGDSKAYQ